MTSDLAGGLLRFTLTYRFRDPERNWFSLSLDQADLARLAGVPAPRAARVASLQRVGAFGAATLQANQIGDPDALLALRVNGADLSLDHGYPARIIVPALPGVHNTKWVASIEFEPSRDV